MIDPPYMIPEALKAQQWERAKGELRALVALQGAYQSPLGSEWRAERYKALHECIEAFIDEIEGGCLHE